MLLIILLFVLLLNCTFNSFIHHSGGVPPCLAAFFGDDLNGFKSDSPSTSIFQKNLEHRGEDNLDKRKYISALTCDKLTFYEDKIDNLFQQTIDFLTENPDEPFLSTWYRQIEPFFLDIHLGAVDHPDFVKRYFDLAFRAIAGILSGCPGEEDLTEAYCLAKEVKPYVEQRLNAILEEGDKSTFLFWWNEASTAMYRFYG